MCEFDNGKEITKENLIEMIKNTDNTLLKPINELKLRIIAYNNYENKDKDLDYIIEKLKNTTQPNLETVEKIITSDKFYIDEYFIYNYLKTLYSK